jgi:dephospho-CoA kinase
MSVRPPIVIGVAGRIGSGKTVVARCLEREFGFQYFRYSLVLAAWSHIDPNDKPRLQDVGGEVMAGEGQAELNRQLIEQIDPTRDAAVDGLRHPVDHESLRATFGARYFLIFVDACPQIRFERSRDRFDTYESFLQADSRPVESNIDALRPFNATIMSGTLTVAELTSKLSEITASFRQRIPL